MVSFGGRVELVVGDITRIPVDAIVNAANSSLLGGGGVDGAIHRVGGPEILAACRELRRSRLPEGLPTGEAVATGAGNLPARAVIHTVGPVWGQDGDPDELLRSAYLSCLRLAASEGWSTVSFPAISTGVYGYPRDLAAQEVVAALGEHFAGEELPSKVLLVFFRSAHAAAFREEVGDS